MFQRSSLLFSLSSSSRLLSSSREAFVPSTWKTAPSGWYLVPYSTVEEAKELHVAKLFSFLNHAAQYSFLGQTMALAEEIDCIPRLEWFFTELYFMLPPTPTAELLACYMNDQERLRCGVRNQTRGTSASGVQWSSELHRRVESRALEDFCWLLTADQRKTEKFLQETYVQWHHRADYLVTRKSREKQEFRQDLTLQQVIQEGQERKRRMQRRKSREEEYQKEIAAGKASKWDNFTHDVLPRELREALDRESDGMEDVRISRAGTATGGWNRGYRTHPNLR